MRRCLILTGVCVLLAVAATEAKEKNTRNFWSLWPSEGKGQPANAEDFTYDGVEFSGNGPSEYKPNSREDDEDFDITSGDDELDSMKLGGDEDRQEHGTNRPTITDDEDEILDSGSGEGIVVEEPIIPENKGNLNNMPKTTEAPLTPCQNLRKEAMKVANYVAECDHEGKFKRRQCLTDKVTQEVSCWCVDLLGTKINGTENKAPTLPGCDFGENLSTCLFQLVQYSQKELGTYKPDCLEDGSYNNTQCADGECWCVDKDGNIMLGTTKQLPTRPDCTFVTTTVKTVVKPKPEQTTESGYDIPVETDDIDVVIPPGKDFVPDDRPTDGRHHEEMEPLKHEQGIMQQPGLLAAIIGGAVVGLLCMVLLVMFIVYRMRKKDEGSYPLDEQKYQNYSYAKAPDKEFYA